MVKPEDVPESIPETDEIDAKKEKLIEELLAEVKKAFDGEYPFIFQREDTDKRKKQLAYKYLKARRWKVADALTMIVETVQFRKDNDMDNWKLFPCVFPLVGTDAADFQKFVNTVPGGSLTQPRLDEVDAWTACYRAFQQSYVNVYHFTDKAGHPVLYDGFGHADVSQILRDLAKVTPVGKGLKDMVVPYHTYMNEVQYYVIRYADHLYQQRADADGRTIMGITVLLNGEGMHMGMIQKRFVNVVQNIFEVDQKYYPEVLHRLFVINAPPMLAMGFNLVKRYLDANTRNKIIFCKKSESLEVLKRVIDEDRIPAELGGKCACAGGCLPAYKPPKNADGSTTATGAIGDGLEVPTETITVGAGKKLERDFPVAVGDDVLWQFALDDTEISFEIYFFKTSAEAEEAKKKTKKLEAALVSKDRTSFGMDSYTAKEKGIVRLVWSNSFSWVHSKSIQMRVWKSTPLIHDTPSNFATPCSV